LQTLYIALLATNPYTSIQLRKHSIMSGSVDISSNDTSATAAALSEGTEERAEGTERSSLSGPSIASAGAAAVGAAATMTVTVNPQRTETDTGQGDVLRLTLTNRPGVTWDENVVDNEGMGRKSSKRCCIFHKQRAFGESSTDTSDYDSDHGNDDRKIARKKLPAKKKTPDHLRFHA